MLKTALPLFGEVMFALRHGKIKKKKSMSLKKKQKNGKKKEHEVGRDFKRLENEIQYVTGS